MADHSAPNDGWLDKAGEAVTWVATHRRKIYGAALVLIPLAARYIPGFPADAFMDAARLFLGA
ncbi:hypothetical protein ACFXMT_14230 [Streptomyces mirabilis]|uniref:hypothetical protein n=1 Tax=Streptomyces mirabilis TaxID=68239 RepID=UPI0036B7BC2C